MIDELRAKNPELHLYSGFMEEIKLRTAAIDRYVDRFNKDAEGVDAFTDAESCVLQVRYICELIALSTLAVHHVVGIDGKLLDSWNAEQTFKLLRHQNADCFPRTVRLAAPNHFEFVDNAMGVKELSSIYSRCGALLHRGVLSKVLGGDRREYDPKLILEWVNHIKALLSMHVVIVPDAGLVFLVTMRNEVGDVEVKMAQSDGLAVVSKTAV